MDFDYVFYNAIREKFKFETNDNEFSTDDGWVDYYATENVPETVINPLSKEEEENHSSITIELSDVKFDVNSYDRTMVPYGDTYVEYEPAGWEIEDVEAKTTAKYMWEGTELSREEYRDVNKMTDDELKAAVELLEERAIDDIKEWLNENYEPDYPDPPDPPDYEPDW